MNISMFSESNYVFYQSEYQNKCKLNLSKCYICIYICQPICKNRSIFFKLIFNRFEFSLSFS